MNKYEELIREFSQDIQIHRKSGFDIIADKYERAVQAIETLIKERDEARKRLRQFGIHYSPDDDASTDTTELHDDKVNHPAHYTQGGIECIDAIKAATEGLTSIEAVCTANAIKYMWRWKWKNGAEDIDKAIWYLNRLKKEINTEKAKEKMNNERA